MKILITIMLGLLIVIGSFLVITLNLLYKDILREFYLMMGDDKNGNIK